MEAEVVRLYLMPMRRWVMRFAATPAPADEHTARVHLSPTCCVSAHLHDAFFFVVLLLVFFPSTPLLLSSRLPRIPRTDPDVKNRTVSQRRRTGEPGGPRLFTDVLRHVASEQQQRLSELNPPLLRPLVGQFINYRRTRGRSGRQHLAPPTRP